MFTFHLYDCQETMLKRPKSNRCNQTEVLLQRDFRLKSLNKKVLKYGIQAWLRLLKHKGLLN